MLLFLPNLKIYGIEALKIFPNPAIALSSSFLDQEIGLSYRKHVLTSCDLFIECDKDFPLYEVEVYYEIEKKLFIKAKTNRHWFTVTHLKEDKCYAARVRGFNYNYQIYTKWFKTCCFHSLKCSFSLKHINY